MKKKRSAMAQNSGQRMALLAAFGLLSLASTVTGADWEAIGKSLDPSGAILYSWNGPDPPCDGGDSTYLGLSCDDNGNVVGVSLPFRGLTGSIPTTLATVATLTTVNLNNNELQGNLPNNMNNLANLVVMVACCNNIAGPIPDLPGLDELTVLDLSNNQLAGNLPNSLSGLTSVRNLELNTNSLGGTIPASLGNLKQMTSLSLNNNKLLTGSIPKAVTDLYRSGSVFNFSGNTGMCGPYSFGLEPCQVSSPPPANQTEPKPSPSGATAPAPFGTDAASGGANGSSNSTTAADSSSSNETQQGIIGPLTLPMVIGIAAGVAALLLLFLLIIFCCCCRKKTPATAKGKTDLPEGAMAAALAAPPAAGSATAMPVSKGAAPTVLAPPPPQNLPPPQTPPLTGAPAASGPAPAASAAAPAAPAAASSGVAAGGVPAEAPASGVAGAAVAATAAAGIAVAAVASARTNSARSPRASAAPTSFSAQSPVDKPRETVVTVEDDEQKPKWNTPKWSSGSRNGAPSPVLMGAAAMGAGPREQPRAEDVDVEAGTGAFGSFVTPAPTPPPPSSNLSSAGAAAAAGAAALGATAAVAGVAVAAGSRREKEGGESQRKSSEISSMPRQGSSGSQRGSFMAVGGLGSSKRSTDESPVIQSGDEGLKSPSARTPRSPLEDSPEAQPAPASPSAASSAVGQQDAAGSSGGIASVMGLWMSGLGNWSKKEGGDSEAESTTSSSAAPPAPPPAPAGGGLKFYSRNARNQEEEEEEEETGDDASSGDGHRAVDPVGPGVSGNEGSTINPPGGVPLPVLRSLSAAYLKEDGASSFDSVDAGVVAAGVAAAAGVGAAAATVGNNSARSSSTSMSSSWGTGNGQASRLPELAEEDERDMPLASSAPIAPLPKEPERVVVMPPVKPPSEEYENEEESDEDDEEDDDDDDEDVVAEGPRWFTSTELAQATLGFSDATVLGTGRYGTVYRATLADGSNIAVKRLLASTYHDQTLREFKFEVDTMVGLSQHANLVALLGASASESANERMLVYEYLPNGTLDALLHPSAEESSYAYAGLESGPGAPPSPRSVLSWPMRMHIALGCARGLSHLHEGLNVKVVHRDVKASNVLLDANWEAKLGDYAMAKILGKDEGHAKTRVIGTFGYVAPEYLNSGILTERSDVYSFGVLLLEIITGRRPVENSAPPEEVDTVVWVKRMADEGRLDQVVDPRLLPVGGVATDDAEYVLQLALRCVENNALKRPKMSQIVKMLESEDMIVQGEDPSTPMTPSADQIWASSPRAPTGLTPHAQGHTPHAHGHTPHAHGHTPRSHGHGSYMSPYGGGMMSPRAESPRAVDAYYNASLGVGSGRMSPRAGGPLYGGSTSPRTAGLGYTGSSGSNGRLVRPNSAGAGSARNNMYPSSPYAMRYGSTGAYGAGGVNSPTTGNGTPLGSRRSTSPRHPSNDVGSLIASAAYKATSPRASGAYYPDSPSGTQPMRSSGRQYSNHGNRSPSERRDSSATGSLIASHAMKHRTSPGGNQGY